MSAPAAAQPSSRCALVSLLVSKVKLAFPDDRGPTSDQQAMLRAAKRDAVIFAATGRSGVGTLADLNERELGLVDQLLDDVIAGKVEVFLRAGGRYETRPSSRRSGGGDAA